MGDMAHRPVMLPEVLDGLALTPSAHVIDATFGRGGHSRAILDRLGPEGRLLALDKDPQAISSDQARALSADPRFVIAHGSYALLGEVVDRLTWRGKVSGVLMDLGVSSPQLDDADRGFSFLRDGPLDMRMDTSHGVTAAEWLAKVSEAELTRVLREYGEERYAGRIAKAIGARRVKQPISHTSELSRLIEEAVPSREKRKHPATRSFQAIRIAINRELEDLQEGLSQAFEVLQPGGRLVVIAFHSLEDRIVKRFMRDEERGGIPGPFGPLHETPPGRLRRIGKATLPGTDEVAVNPRARSAVLRVAEKRCA